MRLNAKTFPSLTALDSRDITKIAVDDAFGNPNPLIGVSKDIFESIIKSMMDVHSQVAHRYCITQPFQEAINKSADKILDNDLFFKNEKSDCGILMHGKTYTMYLINPTDKTVKGLFFGFNKYYMTSYGVLLHDGRFLGRYYELKDGQPYNNEATLTGWMIAIMTMLYFIHNCEIETKIISPNQKHRQDGVKYYNETKSPFTILSCNWFTELIRTTPFTVNGFLRWQACGEGRKQRKLIWVDSFEKKGYHRKAQKLIHDSSDNT